MDVGTEMTLNCRFHNARNCTVPNSTEFESQNTPHNGLSAQQNRKIYVKDLK